MMKKYLKLSDIAAYRLALTLADHVWNIVLAWDYFSKDTIGKQFVRSTDSVSANIAEGFGKYTKKDRIHYYRIAQGSTKESMDWLLKARRRNLVTEERYKQLMLMFQNLPKEIHALINFTNARLTI